MTSTAHAYARHCAQVQGVEDERAERHQAEVERTADCEMWPGECLGCVYEAECLTRAAHHEALAAVVREQIAEDRSMVGIRAAQDYLADSWLRRYLSDESSGDMAIAYAIAGMAVVVLLIRLAVGS